MEDSELLQRDFNFPGVDYDRLFRPDCDHVGSFEQGQRCAESKQLKRPLRRTIRSHNGVIASVIVSFSLIGVPVAKKHIERAKEMQTLEVFLLPQKPHNQRRAFVLRGLGGIGKTQLAVEFVRRRHTNFSAIFWLDGNCGDSLNRSIAQYAEQISTDLTLDRNRRFVATGQGDIELVVSEFVSWLGLTDNTNWLLVFDNVDREFMATDTDSLSYDIGLRLG